MGRAFEALGWEVTSLDVEGEPTIKCDIMDWDYRSLPPEHFDAVWASPVCTEFSKALTRRPRRLEEGDRLVRKTLEIIEHFKPRFWGLENPQTGLLKTRPYMKGQPFADVCYCHYGYPYRKRTRLRPEAPVLRGLALRGLPGRAPPRQGAAGRPAAAPALHHPARAVRGPRRERL